MFESLLNKLNPKSSYSLELVSNLVNKYKIPKCQRPLDKNRLDALANNVKIKFNPITPVYFCVYNNERYIVDGNHRLTTYSNDELIKKRKIPIIDIYVNDEDEIFEYFKLINDTMTLNDIYIDENENKKDIINSTYTYFIEKYPNAFKHKGLRRPYLYANDFLTQLNEIYEDNKDNMNISNSKMLINIIEELNLKYSKMDSNWFSKKGKTDNKNLIETIIKNKCLYLGMCKSEWPNHLNGLPENNKEENITLGFRQSVWNKYCGDCYNKKCLCCNTNEISVFNFECGHILSKKKGGNISIDNIVPICSFCNRSMGTMHMFEYMKKMSFNKIF